MTTYFHVAPMTYTEGEDLLSWDRYIERFGEAPTAWKWEDAEDRYDGHMVCLWQADQLDDAREFVESYLDGQAKIVTVTVDDEWARELGLRRNDEGYMAAMYGRIPSDVITRVETVGV